MDIAHITPYLLIDTQTWSMIKEKDEWDRLWEEYDPTADGLLDKMDNLEKNKPLTKDERLALIKKSAEKESAHDNESW